MNEERREPVNGEMMDQTIVEGANTGGEERMSSGMEEGPRTDIQYAPQEGIQDGTEEEIAEAVTEKNAGGAAKRGSNVPEVLKSLLNDEVRRLLDPALKLFVICLATALCLAVVNLITKDTIALRVEQAAEEQRLQVMSAADSFEKLEGWEDQDGTGLVKEVYVAYSGDKLVGYVFSAVSSGYGGDIPVTVGVGKDGTITGVRVGDNEETPGLGSKVAGEKFISQYEGKAISGELRIVSGPASAEDEIQAISGATRSTKAVNSAVQASADLGAKLLQQNGGGNK